MHSSCDKCPGDAKFKYDKNTLIVDKDQSRTLYRYVYSNDISSGDFTKWSTLFTGSSASKGVTEKVRFLNDKPLTVRRVNTKIAVNGAEHHTDKFEICMDQTNRLLIVRRGDSFNIDIDFSRPFDSKTDNVKIIFETGDNPMVDNRTEVTMDLSENSKKADWIAKIVAVKANTVSVDITPPANCYVVRWRFAIHVAEKQGPNSILYMYQHVNHVYILFNPWCKEDSVYFARTKLLEEYVLNPCGYIYNGTYQQIGKKSWKYGQFDSNILDIILNVMELAKIPLTKRGDPIEVVRSIASVVNAQDDDGILVGSWTGDYSDGARPSSWTGTPAIMEQFHKTKTSVKYGQCWVFAGVSLTLCRALGIPSRCVTNYNSAHDSDGSMTIDIFFDAAGTEKDNSESTWNFHVFNEAWMARPDLPAGFGGWQVFDATPQGLSHDNRVRCGPASVAAIKQGEVHFAYDCPFIFAEVNGDVYYWKDNEHGVPKVISVNKHSVGKHISTKAAGSDEREDITDSYKFPEGSTEETMAINKAGLKGSTRPELFIKPKQEDVTFTVVSKPETQVLGATFQVSLTMKNNGKEPRTVDGRMTVTSMFYTGKLSQELKSRNFENIVLKPGEEKSESIQLTPAEYFGKMEDFSMLNLNVVAHINESSQQFITNNVCLLRLPELTIKTPKQAVVDKPFNIEIGFTNPYTDHGLTDCRVELDGIVDFDIYDAEPVSAGEIFLASIPVTAQQPGNQEIIVAFESKELVGIANKSEITILAQ